MDRIRRWAKAIKLDLVAVTIAARDPRTPWLARCVALFTIAYALSPFDLIQDFVPVLGLIDDILLVPLGLIAAVKLIPPDIMAEARAKADRDQTLPSSRLGLAIVASLWVLMVGGMIWWLKDWFGA